MAAAPSGLLFLCMEPDDAVFGIDSKIVEAVLEADRRFQPDALFLVSTCVPEMAGTDLDALAAELAPRVRARLLVVRTDGFSARHQQQGLRRVLASLVGLMGPVPPEPRSVNVLGLRAEGARHTELVRALEDAGVRVLSTVPAATTVEALARCPSAALNVVVEDYALDLAREMEARFGVPYVEVGFPLAPDRVDEAYAQLEDALGVALRPLVAVAREAAGQAMARSRAAAQGRRAAVAAFAGGPLGAARFLAELGAEPAVVLASRFSRQDARERVVLLASGHDPLVGRTQGTGQMVPLLRSLGVDLYAGHGDRYALARLGIGQVHPDPPRARWGYEATRWAAEMVGAAMGGKPR
ncbi:hypothetical protein caldi_03840 [Caldinitratiruptor microaerophilus]|uniref:Nitrogenase/oxidoreductase component 1 domain-containing protein n=1 Tax=Caldinitratiruptor microaerophilus TaxID=671077 RepID=A0AA35CHV5_9FIRM|nr:hypothetical protein caldi_03840 [Caldinitratiruptor microaerophilus]